MSSQEIQPVMTSPGPSGTISATLWLWRRAAGRLAIPVITKLAWGAQPVQPATEAAGAQLSGWLCVTWESVSVTATSVPAS